LNKKGGENMEIQNEPYSGIKIENSTDKYENNVEGYVIGIPLIGTFIKMTPEERSSIGKYVVPNKVNGKTIYCIVMVDPENQVVNKNV
jgi:hypothetical protein